MKNYIKVPFADKDKVKVIASAEGSSFSAVLPVESGKLGLVVGLGPG